MEVKPKAQLLTHNTPQLPKEPNYINSSRHSFYTGTNNDCYAIALNELLGQLFNLKQNL